MYKTKTKKFRILLDQECILDVEIKIENQSIEGFVLNLRCKVDDLWHAVYRVDTAHGYLHEQRFWISPEPIKLRQYVSLDEAFDVFMNKIKENFERYKVYYLQKMFRR